ncbi:uncharacterized protein LOC132550688 [Ylistrum balloti]|uniref:uncharacterized protein LOC132550688 n=1 Tax=Ylistrum balloti TaxID=509963 RepID=UPI002905C482|nr:uncharacterized protein LOC132550688 [Ylistrum balloti]
MRKPHKVQGTSDPHCCNMTDGEDDLDLSYEKTEALWDSKIVALISQSQKNAELEESEPSSYDEDDEPFSASLDNDKPESEYEDQEILETDSFNLSSQNLEETNTFSTSKNVGAVTSKQAKWSYSNLCEIGIGPKPDVVPTGDCGKVVPTQNGQKLHQHTSESENLKRSSGVSKLIVFDDTDEELEDYVDSDSDEEEIKNSPRRKFGSSSNLKRPHDVSFQSEDSDDNLICSSPIECSSSPDRQKIVARRKFNTRRSVYTEVSDVHDNNTSSQMVHTDTNNPAKTAPKNSEMEPPVKVIRIQNAQGKSDFCQDGNLLTEEIIGISKESKSEGIKCSTPQKNETGNDCEPMTNLSKSRENFLLVTRQGRQSQQTIISKLEQNHPSSDLDQSIAKKKEIDKVCEWFPDACRQWIKLKIEIAIQLGNEHYLDHLVDSMIDGNYPKSTSRNDPTSIPDDKEPDVVVALGNNKIKAPSQPAGRQNETDAGPLVRLYGKKVNYVGGQKGKGKAVVPKKPLRNALDEYESSEEDEKDICMDATESMDTLRENDVSSSSLTCESCKMNRNSDMVVQCCDGHLICNSCVEKEVKEILSPDSQETQINCPSENCKSKVPESQAKKILPNLILELLEEKLHKQAVESISKMEDLVTCPSCSFPVVMDAGIKGFECPNCKNTSCRYCKRLWMMTSHDDCNQFTTFLQENLDSKDLEPPSYWHPMPEEGDKDYVIVTLETKCVEYAHIKTIFSHSMSSKQITAIRRIQNPRLWQKFCLARKHMMEDFGQNQINEKQLFHGTNTKAFDAICREGLDWRMCGENGTAFGQGTYLAKQASYSDRYSHPATGFGGFQPLPPGSSSASFAQALSLPWSFNNQPINNPNPFQPTQQGPAAFGYVPMFKKTLRTFPHVTQIVSSAGTFAFSNSNKVPTFSGSFGPTYNNTQTLFGPSNMHSSTIFHGNTYSQVIPTSVSTPVVSSTTDKIVFTNVEDTINPNKKYMFVARALVGRYCIGNHGMRKPPIDPDDPKRRPFNSCVDNVLTPSIFVIFDCAQCYPEYIIEYSTR